MKGDPLGIVFALDQLAEKQGGSLFFNNPNGYPLASDTYTSAVHYPDEFKPFWISIYNQDSSTTSVDLMLLVNPKDLQIGQVNIVSAANTRRGWVSTLWGSQQMTLTATGRAAGFYFQEPDGSGGLTNFRAKNSLGFMNLQALIALFRNSGHYYLDVDSEHTFFKDGTSRVVTVMDQLLVSYDGAEYLGHFNTFTLEDKAECPFCIDYNFEFIVSGLKGNKAEGHLRQNGNDENPNVEFVIQGSDNHFYDSINLSVTEMNQDFFGSGRTSDNPAKFSDAKWYTDNQQTYSSLTTQKYPDDLELRLGTAEKPLDKTPDVDSANTVKVMRGGNSSAQDGGRISFRTTSGNVYTIAAGTVFLVAPSANNFNEQCYTVVKSTDAKGNVSYIKYSHLEPSSQVKFHDVFHDGTGDEVEIGVLIGKQGQDGGAVPNQCTIELRSGSADYGKAHTVDAGKTFYDAVKVLAALGKSDYKNVWNKWAIVNGQHTETTKP